MTGWNGGPCPVDPDAFVVTISRDGQQDCERAGDGQWEHDGEYSDDEIVKYEVIR